MPLRDGFFSTATQTSCCNRIQRSNRVRLLVVSTHDFPDRHRASKPQGYSRRVLPWQVTMDQLIFASLSHTHYWYEVGMLSVPAVYTVEIVRYSGTLNNGLPDIAVPKSTGTNTPRYSRIQPLYRTHPDIAAYHRYIELYILYYYCSCGVPPPAAHEHQHTNTQTHKHTNKQPPHTYTMRGWRAYDPT